MDYNPTNSIKRYNFKLKNIMGTMGLITQLNPDAIQDGVISISKVDNNVAPKSYVDTAINDIKVNYTTKTYVD